MSALPDTDPQTPVGPVSIHPTDGGTIANIKR
jgi:hypothetical protein